MATNLIDRIPRILSLTSLLGLIGLGGVFDPQLARFSALSFLSFICYFRFFGWFGTPHRKPTAATMWVWLAGVILGGLSIPLYPGLFALSPMLGLIGFTGFLGLYEPRNPSVKGEGVRQ